MTGSARSRWPRPEYHVRATFRAPLPFVFRWCTDYSSADPALEGEAGVWRRKVVNVAPRRVTLEDLEETPDGWDWQRLVVDLLPPDRWHMEAVGNHTDVIADYRLREIGRGQTQLDIWWRRRPRVAFGPKRSKAERESSSARSWRQLARALEKDFSKRR